MNVNATELRLVLKEIEAHPDSWDQGMWAQRTACGTTFCFAGHVVARSPGHTIVWRDGADSSAYCVNEEGTVRTIWNVAKNVLGLTTVQADELFDGGNTLADLRRIVERLCAEGEEDQ